MNKTYIKIDINAVNVNFYQTEFLYGLPSPFVYHSLLKNIELKINNSKEIDGEFSISNGFMITYKRNGFMGQSKTHTLKSRDPVRSDGLVDMPRGYIEVSLIFELNHTFLEIEDLLNAFNILKKLRIAGGNIINYKMQIESTIKNIYRPIGYTQYSMDSNFDSIDHMIYEASLIKKGSKGIKALSRVGELILGKGNTEDSIYKKEHYYVEPIIKFTKFTFLKEKLTEEVYDKYSWKTKKIKDQYIIETNHKG